MFGGIILYIGECHSIFDYASTLTFCFLSERRRQHNANRAQHANMTQGDIGHNKISAAPPPPECNFSKWLVVAHLHFNLH